MTSRRLPKNSDSRRDLKGCGFQPHRKCNQITRGFSRCGAFSATKRVFPQPARTLLVLSMAATLLAASFAFAQTDNSAQTDNAAQTGNAAEPVLKLGPGITLPRATYQPAPEFSEQARKAGYQGTCVLTLVVGTNGRPENIKVKNPIGMGLDE